MEVTAATKKALYRYRWLIFIILLSAYFFVYFQRMTTAVLGEDIISEIGGSIGLLSSVYFWVYTAMQIPSGILSDSLGPRKASGIFLFVATIGSFLTFVGTEFWMVILGKILIATGMAVVYIPLSKIISVWFGKGDFPQLTGIVIAVGNIGAIAATAPLELLVSYIGWREVFLVLGIVTLILSLLCLLFVRDHPHRKNLPSIEEINYVDHGIPITELSDSKIPTLTGLKLVFLGGRKFWTLAIAYFLVYGTIMVFQGTWAMVYFDNTYNFALSVAWFITMIGIGKILSTILMGILCSRNILKSKRTTMIWGMICFTAVWGILWIFSGELANYWFWMLICFMFGFFGGFMTLSFTQVKEWYPLAISGTSVSTLGVFLFLGASIFTTITGIMIGTDYTLDNFVIVWALMFISSLVALAMVYLSVEKKEGDDFVVPSNFNG